MSKVCATCCVDGVPRRELNGTLFVQRPEESHLSHPRLALKQMETQPRDRRGGCQERMEG